MTDERELLLRAILDQPADDAARLVYADKLTELGGKRNEARAELIRVQCELVHAPKFSSPGVPRLVDIDTGSGGPPEKLVVGYKVLPVAHSRYEALRAREAAILKTWAASFLPKGLRGGYPFARVEGATVWLDTLGGYVVFERGFAVRAGCELSLSPGAVGPAALRFGQRLGSLFEANPLTEFTVSFESYRPVLVAEIGLRDFAQPQPFTIRRSWSAGWNLETYGAFPGSAIQSPFGTDRRSELGRGLAAWLHHAIMAPAEVAHAAVDAEGDGVADYIDPDFSDSDSPVLDDGDQGYGSTHW